jgi:fructan beta-fructosidase
MRSILISATALLLVIPASAFAQREDVLIADFESETYGEWTVTGEAFGPGPAQGALPGQMDVAGYEGERLVNSFAGGDDSTGTLTSPEFTIERNHINFLIGGGNHPGEACINLLVGGEAVRTASGPNDQPGGSETLEWASWDVSDLDGRTAVIEIVDRRKGGWGHINIDQITQSDTPSGSAPAEIELAVSHRYLHLPVKNGERQVRMRVSVGDDVVDEFTIELAQGEPDFWVFLDMEPYVGREATISVERLPLESTGLSSLSFSDEVPGASELYNERYRPQFHFSSRRGWNNDPNGLVLYEGEWHMYYQHNPYGWGWGNMHWGHAVSSDLVHWEELPIAIYPREFGDWAFSGGAVVDWNNTAGFQTGDEPPIVAFYTSTGRGECVAYSNDRGRTFTDYEGNPVVRHQGRDPKVIWHEQAQHWVMAVYDETHADGVPIQRIAFYSSNDLKEWTFTSALDGYFECPEIYELPVDDDWTFAKWVVYAADGAYAIGNFDGHTFTPEHEGKHAFNFGDCFYASQTFSDVPSAPCPPGDGRRIQVAWGRTGHASMPFNQQMNFPVELTLRTTPEGIRQFAEPVREIELLHDESHEFENVSLNDSDNPLSGISAELFHIEADIEVGDASRIELTVRGLPIVYEVASETLACKNSTATVPLEEDRLHLELLADRLSLEIFAGHGRVYMPMAAVLADGPETLSIHAFGGTATGSSIEVHELKSAWE